MVLVFDLDDTLYDELTYVKSGFKAVARFLHQTYGLPEEECYRKMTMTLVKGRGRIFDDILSDFELYSKSKVRRCLSVYRLHQPDIRLFPEAESCLERFKHLPIYVVTDGNKIVQKNKLVALGLYSRLNFCFITHRYGVHNAKPSPHCFMKICAREKVMPSEVIYIADNPLKDFVGIRPLGFNTVRVMQGQHKDVIISRKYEADYCINSLNQLDEAFLNRLSSSEEGK